MVFFRKHLVLFSLFFVLSFIVSSQDQGVKYSLNKLKKDSVLRSEKDIVRQMMLKNSQDKYWVKQSDLKLLKGRWAAENKETGLVDGYRVQIGVGPMDSIYKWKDDFIEKYPEIKTYYGFHAPSFKLRVGNFYGTWAFWEANLLANKLKEEYSSVIYVKEKINIEDIIKEDEPEREDKKSE